MKTRYFGAIEVPADRVIELPQGMPGFPAAHRFALLERSATSQFRWLQSLEAAEPAFLVVDPLLIAADYPIDVIRRELVRAGVPLAEDEPIALAAIVTVPPEPDLPTVNLLAPIAIAMSARRGAQVILHDTIYSTREPLRLP